MRMESVSTGLASALRASSVRTAVLPTAQTTASAGGVVWMRNVYVTSLGRALTARSSSVPMTATTVAAVTMEPAIVKRALLGMTVGSLPAPKTAINVAGVSMGSASATLATAETTAPS